MSLAASLGCSHALEALLKFLKTAQITLDAILCVLGQRPDMWPLYYVALSRPLLRRRRCADGATQMGARHAALIISPSVTLSSSSSSHLLSLSPPSVSLSLSPSHLSFLSLESLLPLSSVFCLSPLSLICRPLSPSPPLDLSPPFSPSVRRDPIALTHVFERPEVLEPVLGRGRYITLRSQLPDLRLVLPQRANYLSWFA